MQRTKMARRGLIQIIVGGVAAGVMCLVTAGAFIWALGTGGGLRLLAGWSLLLLGFVGSSWIAAGGFASLGVNRVALRWVLAAGIALVGAVVATVIAYSTGFAGQGSSFS